MVDRLNTLPFLNFHSHFRSHFSVWFRVFRGFKSSIDPPANPPGASPLVNAHKEKPIWESAADVRNSVPPSDRVNQSGGFELTFNDLAFRRPARN